MFYEPSQCLKGAEVGSHSRQMKEKKSIFHDRVSHREPCFLETVPIR